MKSFTKTENQKERNQDKEMNVIKINNVTAFYKGSSPKINY